MLVCRISLYNRLRKTMNELCIIRLWTDVNKQLTSFPDKCWFCFNNFRVQNESSTCISQVLDGLHTNAA